MTALARGGFSSNAGAGEKPRPVFMVPLLLHCSLAGFFGVNAEKSHVLDADEKGASHRPTLRVAISLSRVRCRP
jgi:hypothetical protein